MPMTRPQRADLVLCVVCALTACAMCISFAPLGAQARPTFSGVWILDVDRSDPGAVYGELRVIDQADGEIHVTMVDYGSAWVQGAFRRVVRVLPWTFRIDRWGPRRGPRDSKQPRTIARWSGEQLVLAKSTFSGSGEFVWVWSLDDTRNQLLQQDTRRSWTEDFDTRRPEGVKTYFRRSNASDPALTTLGQRRLRSGTVAQDRSPIVVRVTEDATALVAECPQQDCTITQIESGLRAGSRSLPRGQVARMSRQSEASIEPVP